MLLNQLLFFFSALGVFNGLLLVAYQLLFRRSREIQQIVLGFLGLAFCIRVGVSCLYYFSFSFPWIWVQLGLTAHFLIGPLLLTFTLYGLKAPKSWKILSLVLLGISVLGILIFGSIYNFATYPRIWDYHIRYTIHALVTIFFVLSTIFLFPVFKSRIINKKWSAKEELTALVFIISTLICGGFILSLYTDYVLGPIISSILFYMSLGWIGLKRKRIVKYGNNKIPAHEAKMLLKQLEGLMQEKNYYKTPKLTIDDLATELELPKARLSQLLNDNLGEGFSAYINKYRINEAKSLLKEKDLFTVEAIGYEVGFGSRSSFFATFKQYTGMTPKEFQDKV